MENLHALNFIGQMEIRTVIISWLNNVEITQHKVKKYKYIRHISVNKFSIYCEYPYSTELAVTKKKVALHAVPLQAGLTLL